VYLAYQTQCLPLKAPRTRIANAFRDGVVIMAVFARNVVPTIIKQGQDLLLAHRVLQTQSLWLEAPSTQTASVFRDGLERMGLFAHNVLLTNIK